MGKEEEHSRRVQKKRETSFEKSIYIIRPFLVYLVVKTMAMLFGAILLPTLPVAGMQTWLETRHELVNAVINAIASIIGVCFVLKDFLAETDISGEIEIDRPVVMQLILCIKKGIPAQKKKGLQLVVMSLLGASSALFLNGLLSAVSVSSQKYEQVEKIQYSVPVWLGILLYGLVSPVVEEIVFRGITYHRMRRFFTIPSCVVVSALLFGGFHANLPQFLYGTSMGILLALSYEWCQSFAAPLLFHMTANILVFLLSHVEQVMQVISQTAAIGFFFILSVLLLCISYRIKKR